MSKKIYIGSNEIAGSDGKSAYQSWLDQGNVGTEAQFLASLKGADGKDGKDGAQGNTGSSVDYPYELVNNVTTNDATKGLSAAQGVVLDEKIGQLGLKVNDLVEDTMTVSTSPNLYDKSRGLINGYIDTNGTIHSGTAEVGEPTPVIGGHYYLLSGRNIESVGYQIRCLDSNGDPLKVLVASTGTAAADWALKAADGTTSVFNGEFKAPANAVSVQFQVSYLGVGDDNAIMLTDLGTSYVANPEFPEYKRYGHLYEATGLQDVINTATDLDEKVNGQDGPFSDTLYATFEGKYINGGNTTGNIISYSSLSLAYVPVKKGVAYQIVFEKTCNSAGWLLGYAPVADGASKVLILQDYGKGTNAAATISVISTFNGYLAMGYATGYRPPIVTHNGHIDGLVEDVEDLNDEVFGVSHENNISCYYDATGKYISNTSGTVASYSSLSLAYYPIHYGRHYYIAWPATCNNAGYLLGYATAADGATAVKTLSEYGTGFTSEKVYAADLDSEFEGYLAVGYKSGAEKPIVTETYVEGGKFEERIELLEHAEPLNTSIMFFGDSLTAASSVGIIGFARRIADRLGIPYRAFLFDSGDGNANDVPVDYACFTNYGKDGTHLYIDSDRPNPDSVLERVKRHIDASANVSKILIECTINDEAQLDKKGTISSSYTAAYDTETTLGALEEICRYVSTLGKNFKVGFFIPWQFGWQASLDYFDDHIEVLKKWGLPYLDLRECAGFNMYGCVAHRIYSLSSENISAYSNSTTYNTGSECKYAGEIYVCQEDGVVGIPPTNSDYWTMRATTSRDGTHLNNIGHEIVEGKIREFLASL